MNARLQVGQVFFGIGMIAFGVQHLIYGDFVTRIVPSPPVWLPARMPLAYLLGLVLIAAGAAIIARVRVREASIIVASILVLSIVLLYATTLAANPYQAAVITNTFKALAFCGGALALAQSVTLNGVPSMSAVGRLLPIGRYLFASFLIVGGIQHFMYAPFVATMVPAWIPPSQLFWTYLAGVALIAGGAGIIVPITTRLAATLAGVMILLWVFLLHIPRALADLHNSNETTAVFEALALSGIALMIAARGTSSRGIRT